MRQNKGLKGILIIIALVFASGLIAALVMPSLRPGRLEIPAPPPAAVTYEENDHLMMMSLPTTHAILPGENLPEHRPRQSAAPKKLSPPSIAAQADLVPMSKVDSLALDKRLLRNPSDKMLISNYFSKKYNLEPLLLLDYIDHAQDTAQETGIDPLLLLSIMAIESNFNHKVQSPAGAQGLMQVMTSIHADKFAPYGGIEAAFLPAANIRVGALIIKQAIALMGSLQGGLRFYVGAAHPSISDGGFVNKVLNEYARLVDMLGGNGLGLLHNAMQQDLTRKLPPIPAVPIPGERTLSPQGPSLKNTALPPNPNQLRLPPASSP